MTDRSSRLFEIIQILRCADAPVAAHVIAESLEVTKRTIYRDIVTLQATGVPIEGAAGIGYVMRSGYNLPPLMFTAEEVEAVVVGLSLLGRTGDAGLQSAAMSVSQKIADVVPRHASRPFKEASLLVSRWNVVPASAIDYRAMRAAIRDERKLLLRYRDAEERSTERTICPIALVYYVDSVILAAWCDLRVDFRHFRVDRIEAFQPIDDFFKGEGAELRAKWRSQHELFSR